MQEGKQVVKSSIYYISMVTPLGILYLAGGKTGLCRIDFTVKSEKSFIESIHADYNTIPIKSSQPFKKIIKQLQEYFSGKRKKFNIPLDLSSGTLFQQKVWKTLLEIPYGKTESYKWVARQIRKPKATRAVGNANGKNPIPIIIPCHRVVSSDGGLGGYSAGLHNKRKLLKLEGLN